MGEYHVDVTDSEGISTTGTYEVDTPADALEHGQNVVDSLHNVNDSINSGEVYNSDGQHIGTVGK